MWLILMGELFSGTGNCKRVVDRLVPFLKVTTSTNIHAKGREKNDKGEGGCCKKRYTDTPGKTGNSGEGSY